MFNFVNKFTCGVNMFTCCCKQELNISVVGYKFHFEKFIWAFLEFKKFEKLYFYWYTCDRDANNL